MFESRAEGFESRAEGFESRAEGFKSRAEGFKSRAEGFKSRAEGFKSRATGSSGSPPFRSLGISLSTLSTPGEVKDPIPHRVSSRGETSALAQRLNGLFGVAYELRTENGERRTENGERRTENGERRTEKLSYICMLTKLT